MTVVPNVGYSCVAVQQVPSDDNHRKHWIVGGGLVQLRALICLRPRQSFGKSTLYASSLPKAVSSTPALFKLNPSYNALSSTSCTRLYNVA